MRDPAGMQLIGDDLPIPQVGGGRGGNVAVPSHLDGIVKSPTIWADGRQIMRDGKLLV